MEDSCTMTSLYSHMSKSLDSAAVTPRTTPGRAMAAAFAQNVLAWHWPQPLCLDSLPLRAAPWMRRCSSARVSLPGRTPGILAPTVFICLDMSWALAPTYTTICRWKRRQQLWFDRHMVDEKSRSSPLPEGGRRLPRRRLPRLGALP